MLMLQEAEQVDGFGHEPSVGAEQLAGVIESDFSAVDQAMGFGKRADRVGGKIVSFDK